MHMIRFRLGDYSFSIDISYLLISLYCIIVLCLPNSIINNTTIYMIETPNNIIYKYFTYRLSYLVLPIFALALIYRKNTYAIKFWYIIVAIFLIDILYVFMGGTNLFANGNFSMFLILLQAESVCSIALSKGKQNIIEKANIFLDLYALVSFFTLVMGIIENQTIDGRYYALGLGVGPTGYFSAVYLLYNMYVREFDRIMWLRITLSIFTLIVSGQRTSIIMFIVFCFPLIYKYIIKKAIVKKKTLIRVSIFISVLFFAGIIFFTLSADASYLTRLLDALLLFVNGKIGSESSVSGRLDSLLAGVEILLKNPFGLVNDYYVLQWETSLITFPTFPHSSLISDILLWSTPVGVFCFAYIINLWLKLYKKKSDMHIIVFFIIVMTVIWGGPELAPASFFFRLFFVSLGKIILDDEYIVNQKG